MRSGPAAFPETLERLSVVGAHTRPHTPRPAPRAAHRPSFRMLPLPMGRAALVVSLSAVLAAEFGTPARLQLVRPAGNGTIAGDFVTPAPVVELVDGSHHFGQMADLLDFACCPTRTCKVLRCWENRDYESTCKMPRC